MRVPTKLKKNVQTLRVFKNSVVIVNKIFKKKLYIYTFINNNKPIVFGTLGGSYL